MISQELLDKVLEYTSQGKDVPCELAHELYLESIACCQNNADLHKQLSVLRADKIQKTYVCNN